MKRVGRNVITGNVQRKSKYGLQLSILRKMMKRYYLFRLKSIVKRKSKYASFSSGYKLDLFNAYTALENYYVYKVESLYSKQELREYERRVDNDKSRNTFDD